uniref:B30.2/SPRY domain-containing protein n=2 Tax=Anabas testudineus TaxID=64144 RepID=A0A3Q1I9D2_ANATE
MKMFCRTDQQCICYLCHVDEHKGHDTVSAAAERTERQRELEGSRQKLQQRIQDREKEVNLFLKDEAAINQSANKALRNAEKVLYELIHIFEKRFSDVKNKIKSQQDSELGRLQNNRRKVEQEIIELKRKDVELDKLSHAEDHTYFLLKFASLSNSSVSENPPTAKVRHLQYFEKVTAALSVAGDKLQELLEEYVKITMVLPDACMLPAQPQTRADFQRYACQVTLNPNTANIHLSLSKENRKATFTREEQIYSVHPERFVYSWQVLSRESLTGRCYWEVEKSGRGVLVALAYKDISRAGAFNDCVFGNNVKSWALDCFKNSYEFRHNSRKTPIPGTWSSRIGVYLDHRAGVLSFYGVSETMTLLHRVQTTFTQPLYAGLWLSDGAAAEFCKPR